MASVCWPAKKPGSATVALRENEMYGFESHVFPERGVLHLHQHVRRPGELG